MELNDVSKNNKSILTKLEEYGCDLESLLYKTKDFFSFCDELNLTPYQSADAFMRLVIIYNRKQGNPLNSNILIYKNTCSSPTKLYAEDLTSGNSVFFEKIPEQKKTGKNLKAFKCKKCTNDTYISRSDIRRHFINNHL